MSLLSEIGRELKVSELQLRTVVWVGKRDTLATMWVVEVGNLYVLFRAGAIHMDFFALRCGADLEQITDNNHLPMQMFEYLGKP